MILIPKLLINSNFFLTGKCDEQIVVLNAIVVSWKKVRLLALILLINFISEEKKLEAEIKRAAKQGNKDACKVLAKQLVNLRKQKTRSYAAGAKMSSMQGTVI